MLQILTDRQATFSPREYKLTPTAPPLVVVGATQESQSMIGKYFSSDVHTCKKTTNHESSEKLKEQKKELPSRWLKMVAALGNNSLSLALHYPLTIGLTT